MPPNSSPIIVRQERINRRSSTLMENQDDFVEEIGQSTHNDTPFCDPFFKMSFTIAVYLTRRTLGKSTVSFRQADKMENLTKGMLLKHEIAFRTMAAKLNLTPFNLTASFEAVLKETFSDGCNFGRIVAAYAFFITVLEYCLSHDMEDKVEEIQMVTARVITDQKNWMKNNGGWNGFLDYFSDPSEKFWKGFMVATVGLGAIATLLYTRT